jgi:hypothetical protein
MIHDASYMACGKNSDVKSLSEHVNELNDKLYSILDSKSNKQTGYFEELVKANKGADLYINFEQAKEHGLLTNEGIPSLEELQQIKPTQERSPYQNFKVLMELSEDQKNKYQETKGGKPLDLQAVMNGLNDEQKKPITELQAQLSQKDNELSNLKTSLSQKESELETTKSDYEKKLNDFVANQDKDFIQALLKENKISKADSEKELNILTSLNAVPEAKQSYKNKLLSANKIVAGEIPDNGENKHDISGSNLTVEVIAKKYNLDLKNTKDLVKAQQLYAKELKTNG